MQRHTLLTLCAAAVVATSALGLATARPAKPASLMATMSWNGTTSRDWNVGSNWSDSTVPAAGDIVTIPRTEPPDYQGDPIISNADAFAGDLTIAGPRTVTVTGKKLTLDGSTQVFNGTLILSDITAKVEFTYPQGTDWVALSGNGGIEGQHESAEVGLNDSKIDNDSVIHGILTVKKVGGDTATFKNGDTGIVRANAAGVLSFAAGLTLADETACSPSWEAITNTGAVLEFNQAATNLVGTFVLDDCAKMRFNANITTVGTLVDSSAGSPQGFIDIENSSTFTFRTECDGGSPVSYTIDKTLGSCP